MAIVQADITRRESYQAGQSFGNTGAYERIDGVLTFAVDPALPANQPIVDLELAPRDDQGRVRFRSDFALLVPESPSQGNGKLIVDTGNRGRKRAINAFNRADAAEDTWEIPPGDGFLFTRGFSIVSIGWQWDVFRSDALLGLEAPYAEIEGQPAEGQAVVEIRPNAVEKTRLLANRLHQARPVVDLDDPDAMLLVRDWEDGPDTILPRSHWHFAQESDGNILPSREHVYLESGFQPGKIYAIVYTAEGAPIVGTGLLAVRDVAVWLRHPSALNPVEGGYDRVYGYGVSQTGRMLRHFVYAGLNLDEEDRIVYDGLLPHVAGGRRGEFNHRFAQPSQQSAPGFGHLFPFADNPTTDPLTERTEGLLDRLRELNAAPKVVYTNSSAEYWRGDGSLAHIHPNGQTDLEQAEESRVYHFSGTQHGAGTLPQESDGGPDGASGRYAFGVVDYRPLLRAALINLDRWVSEDIEPPSSRHPRLDDNTAVSRSEVLSVFSSLPDFAKVDPDRLWVLREVDLGPEANQGVGRYPVQEGRTYPCFVSAVDHDGNEIAGIRLPDIAVPVGTHTGWNPRDPETGAAEQIIPMQGFSRFFAPTRQVRDASGDVRPSIEERYPSRDRYLEQVREVTEQLVTDRYLFEEDEKIVISACADRYDLAMATSTRTATTA